MKGITCMNNQNAFQVYNASAGSGKTFTLVKEYLKIILKTTDVFKFQTILAITFTNKATAAMKLRVIESLRSFSNKNILQKDNILFLTICKELNLEASILQKRATNVLRSILNNYASFNITTIDSFTYRLLKNFAFDLGISVNFEVEMDAISLLNEAVDVLISRMGNDKELTKTLIDFSIQKATEDKNWDIAIDLKKIATLLLNEDDLLQVNKIKDRPIQDFINLKNNIYKQQVNFEKQFFDIGKKGLQIIEDLNIDVTNFYYIQFPKFFQILSNQLSKIEFNTEKGLGKSIINELYYTKGKSAEIKAIIDTVIPSLLNLYSQAKIIYQSYLLNKLILHSLIPLAVLRSVNSVLNEIKEASNIRLISEFNSLISEHLKEQPTAFIYEKIGEKYHHYFIDEMQDTSTMQWQNLIPLLSNALSSQNEKGEIGSLLLVGDAKQAIYRWRGGKAEQFIGLTKDENPFLVKKTVENLPINFRSFSEIITFNNSFFQFLSKHLKKDTYASLYFNGNKQETTDKKGGFVQLQFIENSLSAEEKDTVYPEKILEIIQNLDTNFTKDEICILTRTRKQGIAIANFLTEKNIKIISSETLWIQNSIKVQFIINLLKYTIQPEDKDAKLLLLLFLYEHLKIITEKHEFITNFLNLKTDLFFKKLQDYTIYFEISKFLSLPFYESIEHIIRVFKLINSSDAYIQFFLDIILEYSTKKNEGITAFLNYWEEKKDTLSIVVPEGSNAVRIMTIHKAKGLEFTVVIYPYDLDIYRQINPKVWYKLEKENYNNFDSSLINYSTSLKEIGLTGENLYNKQREELELDNFNLLYVALTRAKEQLYIISEHQKSFDEPKKYAQFFINFLKRIGKWNDQESVFKFGNKKRISIKKKRNIHNTTQTAFISSDWKNHNINIVANSTFDDFDNARKYGNIIHEIFAKITTKDDIKNAIAHFINNGVIPLEKENEITVLIKSVVNHNDLKQYFTTKFTVINEREILNDDRLLLIPDRLMFLNNEVTIIDYKTGKVEKKHEYQINKYGTVLEKMNFKVVHKLLVYIDDQISVISV
ncbi:MAG: UvrD-helicase domain-containing protein [Flavobacteriaceae bacterium]|nr:UvrD-helicase domain-containing protein [Flavobacteriaceae bacterium]